jgi:hypothetical protein
VLLSITACTKYPDGPAISLRSRTERIANNWKIGQAFNSSGGDVTSGYTKYQLNLSHTGSASLYANYQVFGTTYTYSTNGTWAFVNDESKISFVYSNNDANGVYQILKLKETELWLKKDDGSLELHLVPQ